MENNMETPLTNNSSNLRPMGIGELLDRAIFFYRTHFLALVTLIALFSVPFLFLYAVASWVLLGPYLFNPQVFLDPETFSLVEYFSRSSGVLALSFVGYLIFPLQAAGVGVAMQGFLLTGRRVSLSKMLAGIRTHLSALLITGLVAIVLQLLLFLTFIIPPVGMVLLTLFFCSFLLAPYAVLYEQMQGLEAIRRSWLLIRGHFWRVSGYLSLLYLAEVIVSVAIGGGVSWAFLSFFANNPAPSYAVQILATQVVDLLIYPFLLSVIALLYFDLRIRNEGLDVALAAAQAAGEPLDLAAIPRNEEPALNRETWKVVGILSAIYIGLFVFFCGGIFLILVTAIPT